MGDSMKVAKTVVCNGTPFTVASPTNGHHYASAFYFGLLLHSNAPAQTQEEAIADVISQMDAIEMIFLPNKTIHEA